MQLKLLSSVCLAVVLAAGPAFAYTTPEEAIAAYIEGVADRDFDAVIAASAVNNQSMKYDFVHQIGRIQTFTRNALMPVTDPMFVEMNKVGLSARIAGQVQLLVYGLMTTKDLGQPIKMDERAAADFVSIVRADRLSGLELVRVGIPSPETLNNERYQLRANQAAKDDGADTSTKRLALLSFEGLNFVVGFHLLKYGDEWSVSGQFSLFGGLGFGQTKRVTPEEFENMLK